MAALMFQSSHILLHSSGLILVAHCASVPRRALAYASVSSPQRRFFKPSCFFCTPPFPSLSVIAMCLEGHGGSGQEDI